MKLLRGLSKLLSYLFVFVSIRTFHMWIFDRYIFSRMDGAIYERALVINDQNISAGVIFFGLYILFSYLANKRMDLLPLSIALVVGGSSSIIKYGFTLDKGLNNLGIITGVISLIIGMIILAYWYFKHRKSKGLNLNKDNTMKDNTMKENVQDNTTIILDEQQLLMVEDSKLNTETNNEQSGNLENLFNNEDNQDSSDYEIIIDTITKTDSIEPVDLNNDKDYGVELNNELQNDDSINFGIISDSTSKIIDFGDNAIKFCHICGNKLIENSLFCNKCGVKIPILGDTSNLHITFGTEPFHSVAKQLEETFEKKQGED